MKTVVFGIPEGMNVMEELNSNCRDRAGVFILLMGEIVEFEIVILNLDPFFKKDAIEKRAASKNHLPII